MNSVKRCDLRFEFERLMLTDRAFRLVSHLVKLTLSCDGLQPRLGSDTVLMARNTIIERVIESGSYSLSDARTDRNNAAEDTAEIAVASQRAAEIE